VTGVPPPPQYRTVPPGGGRSPRVGIAISYGFNKYFANVWPVLGVVFFPIVLQLMVSYVGREVFHTPLGELVFALLGSIVGAVGALGMYRSALLITTGRAPDFEQAFHYDRWAAWFAFSLVYGLIIGAGLLLFIVPGLVALAFFGLAPYYFIDRRMGIRAAFGASRRAAMSRGFAVPVVLSILVGALGALGCFVGVFVTMPAAYVAVAFLYRNAAGQPVSW
jgi:hypothetical protein